jgi:hypothetical protein
MVMQHDINLFAMPNHAEYDQCFLSVHVLRLMGICKDLDALPVAEFAWIVPDHTFVQ